MMIECPSDLHYDFIRFLRTLKPFFPLQLRLLTTKNSFRKIQINIEARKFRHFVIEILCWHFSKHSLQCKRRLWLPIVCSALLAIFHCRFQSPFVNHCFDSFVLFYPSKSALILLLWFLSPVNGFECFEIETAIADPLKLFIIIVVVVVGRHVLLWNAIFFAAIGAALKNSNASIIFSPSPRHSREVFN